MSEPNVKPETPNAEESTTYGAAANEAATAVLEDLQTLRTRAQERDQFLALLQRTQADFENYQKRNQRELEIERRYRHFTLAFDLLPALDNLDRALAAAQQSGENSNLVQGVRMVQTQLLDTLRRHGITRIEALGQPFDPNLHQAVMQQPAADQPPNTIVQVLEQGFMIHDRVLRPARVVVAVPPDGNT